MANLNPQQNVLPPAPDFPYILDGVHDGIYDQSKHYWNTLHSRPYLSMDFFLWCVRNWMYFGQLYTLSSEDNFNHLFQGPYRYFHALVIVGALSELEIYRYDWSSEDPNGRLFIGFLYNVRNLAASAWHEDLVFNDTEDEYYSEAQQGQQAG